MWRWPRRDDNRGGVFVLIFVVGIFVILSAPLLLGSRLGLGFLPPGLFLLNTPIPPHPLQDAEMFFRSADVRRGGEWRHLVTFDANVVSKPIRGVVRCKIIEWVVKRKLVGFVVAGLAVDTPISDCGGRLNVRGERHIPRVAKEHLTNARVEEYCWT
jgi:hypothetical protein